jgi:hypothetical protein
MSNVDNLKRKVTIKLYEHPLAVVEPKIFEANSVAEWLFLQYGESPSVTLQIYKGEPSADTEVSSNVRELTYGKEDYYTVLQNPGLPPPVVAFLIQVAIAVAISVVMSVLFPPPDMPGNVNRTQSSPNNSLASRENQVRLNQRVEDIYGTVKAIPSLMMPTYNKYVNHKQMEYGYYCVGRGYYDITNLKDGDTPLSYVPSSKASVYSPFTSPNSGTASTLVNGGVSESIYSTSRSAEVDGLTLKAQNQVQIASSTSYKFSQGTVGGVIEQARNASGNIIAPPNFNSVVETGDKFVITSSNILVADAVYTPGVGGDPDVLVTPAVYTSVNGEYIVDIVGDGEVTLVTSPWTNAQLGIGTGAAVITLRKYNPSTELFDTVTNYTDWVILPDKDSTQIWCNIVAPGGMYVDTGSGKSTVLVTFSLEVQLLDTSLLPTGPVYSTSSSLSGATTEERAFTLEYNKPTPGYAVRVRMKRVENYPYGVKGTRIDEIKWRDLYSVTPSTKANFGNKTTIHTVTQATTRATNIQNRQLNCIASRKLPTYNGSVFSGAFDSTGLHVSGTISATSKIVNILAAVVADPRIGNNISQLDLSQCWGVQQELDAWSLEAGQFNYTFDSDSASFEETVTLIANAGFCLAYRQNGKIRLAFDKLQPYSTALFTHRNKKPNAETITRTFATDSEYEGVEFVYRDPLKDTMETILLPLGTPVSKYKKFEIPGIRSFTQAWYRANREYKRLLGQRLSIETDCTTDARLLLPNTRIDVVDNTRFKAYDGEVIKQEGLVLTLSRDVVFGIGVHSILLMKRDGSLQSIICTQGTRSNQVILQSAPAEAVVTIGGYDGIRTIFSFASDDARASQAWLVQEVGMSDNQYIKVKAINYSHDYYYYDTQTVPSRDSVINS